MEFLTAESLNWEAEVLTDYIASPFLFFISYTPMPNINLSLTTCQEIFQSPCYIFTHAIQWPWEKYQYFLSWGYWDTERLRNFPRIHSKHQNEALNPESPALGSAFVFRLHLIWRRRTLHTCSLICSQNPFLTWLPVHLTYLVLLLPFWLPPSHSTLLLIVPPCLPDCQNLECPRDLSLDLFFTLTP